MGNLVSAGALQAYLQWVTRVHGYAEALFLGLPEPVKAPLSELPWIGTLAEDESNQHARSREVDYLRRSASPAAPPTDVDEDAALAARPLPTYLTSSSHVDRFDLNSLGRKHPAQALLDSIWRCVILGDPGSGKSTLVRWVALQAARRDESAPGFRLPVLCRATSLTAALSGEAPADGHSLARLAMQAGWDGKKPAYRDGTEIPGGELAELAAEMEAQRRLLLIVDGIDEVSTRAERARLVAALDGLVSDFGPSEGEPGTEAGNQLIVTSRFVGYYATPLGESVRQLILCPMDDTAVMETGEFWLRHYASRTHQEKAAIEAMLAQFRQVAVGEEDSGQVSTSNPILLVSLLSAVASGRLKRRKLRTKSIVRSDLYDFMLEDALDSAPTRITSAPPRELLRGLHTAMAYRMHQTASGVLDPEGLRNLTARALADLGDPAGLSVDSALRCLQEGGLLTARGQNLYGFIHLTLEEYLAGLRLVEGPSAAELLNEHIADPRWVEATRLGLGHLGRNDPRGFHNLIRGLLRGPASDHVASLLITDITELDAVRPPHIETAVMALLSADVRRASSGSSSSGTGEILARLRHSPVTLPGDEQPMDVVCRVLARVLRGQDGPLLAAAARAVDALGLADRNVAEALFHAQERDSSAYGWPTVRALQALNSRARSRVPDSSGVAAKLAWDGLTAEDRATLSGVRVSVERRRDEPDPDSFMPESLTPFRSGISGTMLATLVSADVAVQRMVLCLYGGVAFGNGRHWARERQRLEGELGLDGHPADSRHAAAIELDTAVLPMITSGQSSTALDPSQITVDSPITPLLLNWLRRDATPAALAERLRLLAQDESRDDRVRGDALAAWLALGTPDAQAGATDLCMRLGEGVRRRFAWRLDRAHFLLSDAVSRLKIGQVAGPCYAPGSTDPGSGPVRAVIRALCEIGRGAPELGDLPIRQHHPQDYLVAAAYARSDDNVYSLAVVLDTAGATYAKMAPRELARLLATAHEASVPFGRYSKDWDLDPFAPMHGNDVAEALTALGGLSERYTFFRCWLLDRLVPLLADSGYVAEALCLALHGYRADPTSVANTVLRFARAAVDDLAALAPLQDAAGIVTALEAMLPDLVDATADPYARARAAIRLAARGNQRFSPKRIMEAVRPVPQPYDRLRLLELAISLRVVDWGDGIASYAIRCARTIADDAERHRALLRILRDLHEEVAREAEDHMEDDPGLDLQDAEAGPATGQLLAPALFDIEPLVVGSGSAESRGHWAVLTAAALTSDALATLRTGGQSAGVDEADLWAALGQSADRAAAARSLYVYGQSADLRLDAERCAILDSLLGKGHGDLVAQVLAVSRLTRRLGLVERWRAADHRRVADLAALLLIELGQLDSVAVDALPRLLQDHSDLVRIRAGLATSVVSRGRGGTPLFSARGLGPRVLADLAHTYSRAVKESPAAAADLYWALTDVVLDSPETLAETLPLLAEEPEARRRLLASAVRVTPSGLVALPELLGRLTEVDQCALLYAMHDIAMEPARAGVLPTVIELLSARLDEEASALKPAAWIQLHSTLGLMLPVTGPSVDRLTRLVRQGTGSGDQADRSLAVAAAYGLGLLLKRNTGSHIDAGYHSAFEDAVRALADATRTGDEELTVTAVGALLRASGDVTLGAGEPGDASVSRAVMWGLMGQLDMPGVGDYYYGVVAKIVSYIRKPPGLSQEAAVEHTTQLTRELLTRLDAVLAMDDDAISPRDYGPYRQDWQLYHLISVAADLAKEHPAPLRVEVDERFPDLRRRLVSKLGASSWLVRQNAARLVILLGVGDRETVLGLLDIATGTDTVRQRVLHDLRWFHHVRPDGLAALIDAMTDPNPGRCQFAIMVISALLEARVLDDADHMLALRAIERGLDRADADEHVLMEIDGRVMPIETYAENGRRVMARLVGRESEMVAHAERSRMRIEIPDAAGNPLDFTVAESLDGTASLLTYQIQYFRDVERRQVPAERIDALDRASVAGRARNAALSDVLACARAT